MQDHRSVVPGDEAPSYELQLIGGGRMGEALLGGLLAAGTVAADRVAVVERDAARREQLVARFDGVTIRDRPARCDGAIVATKPAGVLEVLEELAAVGVERVLSIAAGIAVGDMERAVGGGVAVVRAMPNTPALVGQGAAAIAGGTAAGEQDLAWAESMLGAVGTVVRVPEADIDAVTGLSGSGPAYVFLVAEAMIAAGVAAGLSHDVADGLVRQTLLGAATLLCETGDDPAALRAAVTSPGGTTAAGLAVLAQRELPDALREAVLAATARSRELGS
jgi:pyrroline-5-carboxylate reductase